MSDEAELYLQRSENELIAAQIFFEISSNLTLQKEQFKLEKDFTSLSGLMLYLEFSRWKNVNEANLLTKNYLKQTKSQRMNH